tara:strand:+ start:272 stop:442 length:171 start_codon:yes stop_codon:yes gene_type:complete
MKIIHMTTRPSARKSLSAHIPFNPSRSRQGIVPIMSPDTSRKLIGSELSINPKLQG